MSAEATPKPAEDEALAGSVNFYQQHLAVCSGGPPELWAARVEEMEGLFGALEVALRLRGLHTTIKLTACDAPSMGGVGLDIFLMPDMLVLPEITVDRCEALAEALAQQFTRGLPFDVRPMAGGDHLFVCTHSARDARCGDRGEPLYAALRAEVASQGAIAHVHRSSHIGGHRFAATCIVYPQGLWYGNLRPHDAPRLVREHLIHEQLLPDHYRGRLGTSPCQQVAEATAARVLLSLYPDYDSLVVTVDEQGTRAEAVARARVRGEGGWHPIRAEFTLSCPLVWWSADGEPHFATD